jgi:anti-sigma B factor antagonist
VTRSARQPSDAAEIGVLTLPRSTLAIGVSAAREALLVEVIGELDLASAPRLASCLSDLRGRAATVEVDLAGVTFIDLSGLRVLLDAQRDAHLHGMRLRIVAPGWACARLLALTQTAQRMLPD